MNNQTFQHINLQYLDLMADGDDSVKKILLEMLIGELPSEIDKMVELENEKKWKELSEVSHKLKSTLAYVGNDVMTIENKQIEKNSKSESNLNDLADRIATLKEYCEKVLPELQEVVDKL